MLLKKTVLAFLMLTPLFAYSSDLKSLETKTELAKLTTFVRMDYQRNYDEWDVNKANTGFEGKYFMFRLEGTILPGLEYSWRQRLNKRHNDSNFFDATDWLYLNYRYKNFSFSGGKQIVGIGGWEYDRFPVDVFQGSVFWQNVSCFQLGGSVSYHFNDRNMLTAQMTESPFFNAEDRDLYSYNLLWTGKIKNYSALWSANMVEYAQSHYISYLSIGNRFDLADKFIIEMDFMNRAADKQVFMFKDCSVIATLRYMPNKHWCIGGKYSYDVNKTTNNADLIVLPGTELNMAGLQLEYFPLVKKKTSLRFHLAGFYSWGNNTNTEDVMKNKSSIFSVGVTWRMHLLSLNK